MRQASTCCLGLMLLSASLQLFAAPEPIAIVGSGMMGGTLGTRWGQLGHPIIYGSRDPQRADVLELVKKSGGSALATSPAEAVRRAAIVVLAVPWEGAQGSAESLGDVRGKIVIDVTNPLVFEGGKDIAVDVPHSGAELIQGWLPGATVVKAFNTVNWRVIADPARAGGPVTVPIAANDQIAKQRVTRLVEALGFEVFDAGRLANARYLEGMALLYVNMLTQDPPQRFEYYFRTPTKSAAPAGVR